jgi:hypothetical protein
MNCGQTAGKTWKCRYCQTPRVDAEEMFVDPTLRDRGTEFSEHLRIAYDKENYKELVRTGSEKQVNNREWASMCGR